MTDGYDENDDTVGWVPPEQFNIGDVVDFNEYRCVIKDVGIGNNRYFISNYSNWVSGDDLILVKEASDLEEAEVDECGPKKVFLVFHREDKYFVDASTIEDFIDRHYGGDSEYIIREVEVWV
jgi:hypothetical protein